jgi:hypothetical protein
MMTTSVKMLERDKERLDRLQGEIMARQGRRVPQQTILSWLLDLGEAEKHRLAEDAFQPMSRREIAGLKRLAVRTGIPTREEEIDALVAGEVR